MDGATVEHFFISDVYVVKCSEKIEETLPAGQV